MRDKSTRRAFLRGAGTAAIVSLSGCNSPATDEGSTDLSNIDIAKPAIQSNQLKGWTETDAQKAKLGARWGTTPYIHFRTFENTAFRQRVKRLTLGEFDNPLAKFFAAHIDLRGLTTAAATPKRLIGPAADRLQKRMKASGIKNIHEIDPDSRLPTVAEQTREYLGEFHYDGFSDTMDHEKAGEITLEVEGGTLEVRGFISTWKEGTGTAFAAGGAYPAEPFRKSSTTSVTGKQNEGLDLVLIADLQIDPQTRRAEIIELCESVTLDSSS